jgi:hypothetical protein
MDADTGAMEQALPNSLTNAMKFSGDSREIRVTLWSRHEEAIIEIADQGIGIPAEHRRRVFERFFRVPSDDHQAVPGTGVGLTLVEGIMTAHPRDNTPKGVFFSVPLPVAKHSWAAFWSLRTTRRLRRVSATLFSLKGIRRNGPRTAKPRFAWARGKAGPDLARYPAAADEQIWSLPQAARWRVDYSHPNADDAPGRKRIAF